MPLQQLLLKNHLLIFDVADIGYVEITRKHVLIFGYFDPTENILEFHMISIVDLDTQRLFTVEYFHSDIDKFKSLWKLDRHDLSRFITNWNVHIMDYAAASYLCPWY
jgi:hypothetical protein